MVPSPFLKYPYFVLQATTIDPNTFTFLARHLLCLPSQDIRLIDFSALKRMGYQGVIFDKDNCIVRPKSLLYLFPLLTNHRFNVISLVPTNIKIRPSPTWTQSCPILTYAPTSSQRVQVLFAHAFAIPVSQLVIGRIPIISRSLWPYPSTHCIKLVWYEIGRRWSRCEC